ncbi:MAG: DUF3592 domain-containing protein [Anaerolineae bacterium]|nr:DUF3592 domain-containing protein [Anaerolineae bacterium]
MIIALLIQLLMIITPAISAVTLGLKYDELKRGRASKEWPAVKAAVTNSTIVDTGKKQKGQNLYQPEISLSYSVESESYTVKQRPSDTNGQREGTKQWAREVALQYKPDTAVRLYYNPQRPQQATVLPGQATVNKNQWLVIGSVMLLFSFILCVLGTVAITQNYLTVSTAVSFILGIVAFGLMLMLGFLLYLLAQEFRPK